jgi:tetratricopeptide (TPR) repeat protein
MRLSKRTIFLMAAMLLVAGVALAYLLRNRRSATTSSEAAYRDFVTAREDIQRSYRKDARRHLDAALAEDPHFAMAMVYLSMFQLEQDDRAGATRLLDRADAERERLSRRERLVLDLMRSWSRRDEAGTSRLARTLADDYSDPIAYTFLANDAIVHGRQADAEKLYREWLKADPNNAQAYNDLGYSAAYRGDFPEAIRDLNRYVFMAPDEANPYDSLGEIESSCGRYEDALRDLNRALAIKPDFDPSLYHWALAEAGLGHAELAAADLEKAAASDLSLGERFGVFGSLFFLRYDSKDFNAAFAVVDRISALKDPGAPNPAPLYAGLALSGLNRFEEARRKAESYRLEETVSSPDRAVLESYKTFVLATILFDQKHYAEAAKLLETVQKRPEASRSLQELRVSIRFRDLLARALAKTGDRAGAEALIAVNERINPRDALTVAARAELGAPVRSGT